MSAHTLSRFRLMDLTLVVAVLVVAWPQVELSAQETDARWLPWFGCWDAVAEGAPMLCFMPREGDRGVDLVTVVDGDIVSRETVLADGLDQTVNREGCEGWERAEFSEDGRRVYFRSEFICAGDIASNTTGVMSMVTPREWVDIKSVEVDGETAPFVMRYLMASAASVEAAGLDDVTVGREGSLQAARYRASRPVTIDNVLDVNAHVDIEGLEAWVAEASEKFPINTKSLVQMADAGLPDSVIDLMIAISFPDDFAIDRDPDGPRDGFDENTRFRGPSRYGLASGYYGRYYNDPFFVDRYYSPYYGYRYSRYGYGSIYGYGGYGVYSPTVVVVAHHDDSHTSSTGGAGRVVRGRGYSSGGGSRRATASSGGSSKAPSAASSSSARNKRSPSRSSSSTGRKAKRRGGGL